MRGIKKLQFCVDYFGYSGWGWLVTGDKFEVASSNMYSRKSDAKRGLVRAMKRIHVAYDNYEEVGNITEIK